MDPSWYPVIKALHLIFMVTFFAGTFYIVRLFIYHREALAKFEPDRTILTRQYALMEKRLWYFITWPSFVLMVVFGIWMLAMNPILLKQPWMHAKLGLVALLTVYHFVNQRLFAAFRSGAPVWKGYMLRVWNEGATLILFGVVFLASLKRIQWYYGVIGLVILGAVLLMAINLYRRARSTSGSGTGTDAATRKPGA